MKKRAILITPLVPGKTGNGLSMRAGIWLECLSQDFDVDLVVVPIYPAHPSAPDFARHSASTINILTPLASETGLYNIRIGESDIDKLHNLARAAALVVVFRLVTAELTAATSLHRLPSILDLDDVDWVREERLGNQHLTEDIIRKTSELSRRFDLVTFAQPHSSIPHLSDVVSANVMTIPNASRAPESPSQESTAKTTDLLFVGTLGYAPNEEGLLWFITEVVPLLPGVRVTLVGANPTPELLSYQSSLVRIHANVPEVSSWYRTAHVAIVPLFAGSGTRIKILEAWAHHTPVVTTSMGIEGILNTQGALIADSASAFAAACASLLHSPDLARSLAQDGHQLWQDHYSLSSSRHHISLAVEKVLPT
ncbi:glycosyltransferase [Aurantimicrobium photophilum]|uniref:Glycosyltransferase n=1 Tax=Aurantimicrobium photophilum TaxID=1987356 RepID=A0A2Z3RZL3_9MICO|nr:glycosyltransferase [Aurantimicrobium photophilum]AWR20703.1 hypothetical protein AURMO_00078 [Aurantimicrobium photophilum]